MENNAQNINWYPGHMAKTRRQMSEYISLVDIVYEVVDARMPMSSRIKDINLKELEWLNKINFSLSYFYVILFYRLN